MQVPPTGGAQSKAEPLHSRRLCRRSPPLAKNPQIFGETARSQRPSRCTAAGCVSGTPSPKIRRFLAKRGGASPLLLLMLRILADDHHAALAADDLALFTNRLYRRFYLHGILPPSKILVDNGPQATGSLRPLRGRSPKRTLHSPLSSLGTPSDTASGQVVG